MSFSCLGPIPVPRNVSASAAWIVVIATKWFIRQVFIAYQNGLNDAPVGGISIALVIHSFDPTRMSFNCLNCDLCD